MNGKQCKKIRRAVRQVPDIIEFGYRRNTETKQISMEVNCYRKIVKILKNRFKKLNHVAKATVFN